MQPLDLPGPDSVIDPAMRMMIRPLVGLVYDAVVANLEAKEANDDSRSV